MNGHSIGRTVRQHLPKLKVKMQSLSEWWCSEKTSWKAKFWAGGERCTQTGKVLHLPAGRSRSSGQHWESTVPTVDHLTGGPRRRLVPVERSDRLPGRLRTGTSVPRYGGALQWRTLNVSRAILYAIHSNTYNQWRVASASVMRSAPVRQHSVGPTDCSRCTMCAGRLTSMYSITVVRYWHHQCYHQWLECGRWHRTTDLSEFSTSWKALRHRWTWHKHDHVWALPERMHKADHTQVHNHAMSDSSSCWRCIPMRNIVYR